MYIEYINILFLLIISSLLGLALWLASYILVIKTPYTEKVSAYECGFHPFEDTRNNFSISFHLVGILFIIFDLEITLLIPWALSLGIIDLLGQFVVLIFLFILTVGFFYEWKKGALEWK